MKNQKKFHHITLKGEKETHAFSDERVKKSFLDTLNTVREEIPFQMYAFCVTNHEAHFLVQFAEHVNVEAFLLLLQEDYDQCCQLHALERHPSLIASYLQITIENTNMLLEYSARIHQHALRCAKYIEDHWWSSYNDYTNRFITGLVATDEILKYLDISPRKAAQKFASFHKKICYR